MSAASLPTLDDSALCQGCGACCAYSRNWPRFTIEDDAEIDLIPEALVNERLSGMKCDGERCAALSGKIGNAVTCTIYTVRPQVCRVCLPGDAECNMARRRFGFADIVRD
jgi:Fe-S-cluster containining protein